MRARVLGTVQLQRGETAVPLPAGKVGRLLARLLITPEETLPAAELVAHLWPDQPDDASARRRLQVTVSRLRAFLAGDDPSDAGGLEIVHADGGYQLVANADAFDRVAFEGLAERALRRADASLARRALRLWGGQPYHGLPASTELRVQQIRLGDLRRQLTDLQDGPPPPDAQLLRGKVQPPGSVGSVVERRALLDAMPAVGQVRAITIVAPAGYGKSTLLVQWAARQAVPVAWLSLEPAHEDASRFWADLFHSFRWATSTDLVPPEGAAPGSSESLDHLGELVDPAGTGFGIVLDDLHHLGADQIGEVERLLEVLPSTCTVVLASRNEPSISMARMEALGVVHRVGADDLPLSIEEVQEATGVDAQHARRLHDLTEGWPVAVVAIHRSGAQLPPALPPVVDRYVVEEILRVIPADVVRLVFDLAHLDAFDAALATAAAGRDIQVPLHWLRSHGLFLVDLGSTHGEGWSRLHHLVAAVARRHAGPEVDVTGVRARAAAWSRAAGLAEQALTYAVRAGDSEGVSASAGDVLLDAALRGEAHTCVRWLRRIRPDDLVHDLRAHSVAVYLATEWMTVEERGPWLRSRRRHFGGDEDLVLRLVEATEAMRSGRTTEAVEATQSVMDGAMGYVRERQAPEMGAILIGSAASNMVRARAFQATASSDAPVFADVVALLRPHGPLLATWVHSYWGLVALVDGDTALAAALSEEFYRGRRAKELSRPVHRDNSMLGCLVAAHDAVDAPKLRALARGIEDLPPHLTARGQYTDAAIAELTLANLYLRAGDRRRGREHRARAELLLQTFEDAPFFDRLCSYLDALAPGGPGLSLDQSAELTPRQTAIAELLPTELGTREMAELLHISHHTLRTHLRDIYRRLGVGTRHQAVLALRSE